MCGGRKRENCVTVRSIRRRRRAEEEANRDWDELLPLSVYVCLCKTKAKFGLSSLRFPDLLFPLLSVVYQLGGGGGNERK